MLKGMVFVNHVYMYFIGPFFFCTEQVGHNPCMVVCVPFGGKCLFYLPNGTHFSFISDDVRVSEDSEAHLVNQRFFFIMIHPFEKKNYVYTFPYEWVFFNEMIGIP